MVDIETIDMEAIKEKGDVQNKPIQDSVNASKIASEERILDVIDIEQAASKMTRPSARAHLEALAQKLRQECNDPSPINTVSPPALAPVKPVSISVPTGTSSLLHLKKYNTLDSFAFDAGGYNSPTVTVYVTLNNVGSISRDNVKCTFATNSFDLTVHNLNGKNYRLLQDNLDKDIDPANSKHVVKSNKVIIKLAKVKGNYGYDSWQGLTAKKPKKNKSDNPTDSIMDMMKDMYDGGDDKMKKMIGETMMKQRNGELGKTPPGSGLGGDYGMDGMDDF